MNEQEILAIISDPKATNESKAIIIAAGIEPLEEVVQAARELRVTHSMGCRAWGPGGGTEKCNCSVGVFLKAVAAHDQQEKP